MIPLRIRAEADATHPFVVRLVSGSGSTRACVPDPRDAVLASDGGECLAYQTSNGGLRLYDAAATDIDGDVLLVVPEGKIAHRLIRARSSHNTLVVTEQCDQLCVMCSQPPKKHHRDLFAYFEQAVRLAPPNAGLVISGGEPTLYKEQLFAFLVGALADRPDLHFHILTNGQHFEAGDVDLLRALPRDHVLWGIPLYSTLPAEHDEIVAKAGAFEQLTTAFAILGRAGAAIELRTVVMRGNVERLPQLARYVATHLPFVSVWAIMQLENIGFARMNWASIFCDSSVAFESIGAAVDIATGRGVSARLYNFPLCTVPIAYRTAAVASISDWKRRYLDRCDGCTVRATCGGFFEWYPEKRGFARVGLQ